METIQAIKTRRAVRGWNDQAIPDRTLSQILEAGRFSPSPLNSQPWHFIIIRQKETMANLSSTAQHGSYLAQANVIIVVTVDKNCPIDQWLSEHEQHIYSGVCALQNMWLAAWDLGIGGGWVTVDNMTTRKFLDIPNPRDTQRDASKQAIRWTTTLLFMKEKNGKVPWKYEIKRYPWIWGAH